MRTHLCGDVVAGVGACVKAKVCASHTDEAITAGDIPLLGTTATAIARPVGDRIAIGKRARLGLNNSQALGTVTVELDEDTGGTALDAWSGGSKQRKESDESGREEHDGMGNTSSRPSISTF